MLDQYPKSEAPGTEHPEKQPPRLQFHHVENGEANLNPEGLSPEEKVAARIAAWVTDVVYESGTPEVQSQLALPGASQEVAFRRTGEPNFLFPSSMRFVTLDDAYSRKNGIAVYSIDMFGVDGFKTGEITAALPYDIVPGVDEDPEYVVNDIGITFGSLEIDNVDPEHRSEFLEGVSNAVDTLQSAMPGSYERLETE